MDHKLVPLATDVGTLVFDRYARMPLRIQPLESVEDAWKFLDWVGGDQLRFADSLKQQALREAWNRFRHAPRCQVKTAKGVCGAYLMAGETICECCAEDERLETMRRAV